MARLTRAYPHLPPGVVRVIGATGIDPDHDIARTVAKLEAMRQASSPTGFGNPLGAIRRLGRQVTGMQQYISDLSDINTGRETVQTQHRIPRIQPPGTRPFMKPEEVTRPYPTGKTPSKEQMKALAERVGPERAGAILENIPGLARPTNPIGPGSSFHFDQILPNIDLESTPVVGAAGRRAAGIPGVEEAYNYGIKPASRFAFAAASYPLQETNNLVRNIFGVLPK